MEKLAEIAILIDIYGTLLTKKQKDVIELYYNHDLSLAEIAENVGISRQGVYDLIKRGERTLRNTDKKLNLLKRMLTMEQELNNIIIELNSIITKPNYEFTNSPDNIKRNLSKVIDDLAGVLNIS